MISIRKAVSDLDKLEELSRTAVSCYTQAVRSAEVHAIDVDPALVSHFRAQLQLLETRLEETVNSRELQEVQEGFDTELRAYQEKTRNKIEQLRKDMQAAKEAVEALANSITGSESDLDVDLKQELQRLNRLSDCDSLQEIREGIHKATARIAASFEQMRSCNRIAIAQMRDEIRLLHQEIQEAKKRPEPVVVVESQRKINSHVEDLQKRGAAFSVLLVVVNNLEGLRNCYSVELIENGLKSFERRLSGTVPDALMVGRWSSEQFAAVMEATPKNAMALCQQVTKTLSAPFVELGAGKPEALKFLVKAGVTDFRPGSDASKFQAKIQQLAMALSA